MENTVVRSDAGVSIADKIKTVSLLYDGALNFMQVTKKKIEHGDSYGKEQYVKKTIAIVEELSRSLNPEGGEIAQNLQKLYEYVLISLQRTDKQNDLKALDDAGKVLGILRDTWKEIQEIEKCKI